MQSEYVTKSEFNAATGCHSHSIVTLDPWLCVPVFQQVCLYIYYIALRLKCQHFVPYFPSFFCLFFPESAILLSVKEKRKHDITGERQICQKFYLSVSFLYCFFPESSLFWQAVEIQAVPARNHLFIPPHRF